MRRNRVEYKYIKKKLAHFYICIFQEKSTGNVELRQQLSTLQHKVQTLEEQVHGEI